MVGKDPLNASEEHQDFRLRITRLKKEYKYFCKLDISNCFSNFYHHDIVSALVDYVGGESSRHFGIFLRQINGGRSISCFPQGYFASKALGNWFMHFIEDNASLKSAAIIRFVDDVFMFSDVRSRLESDFYAIQTLLSERNLYLNASKSLIGDTRSSMLLPRTDQIKKSC